MQENLKNSPPGVEGSPDINAAGELPKDAAMKPVKKSRRGSKAIQEILGGDYLSQEKVVGNIPYLFYIALLAMLYIGNTYYTEKKFKDIERTKTELKELRYQYITTKSALMFMGRQSEISRKAELLGLKERLLPPYKIMYNGTNHEQTKE